MYMYIVIDSHFFSLISFILVWVRFRFGTSLCAPQAQAAATDSLALCIPPDVIV